MRALLVGISLVSLAAASGCTNFKHPAEAKQSDIVHPCTKNPLLRTTGIFGGPQPEIFLTGPDLRRELPPVADELIRVLTVTEIDNFRDLDADPVIDKCRSRLQLIGEEVELTIKWHVRNCPDSFEWDDDDSENCDSRASFRFSIEDLGLQKILNSVEDPESALQSLVVVDAYFAQVTAPARRHSATGMPVPPTGEMHLVVRVSPTFSGGAVSWGRTLAKERSTATSIADGFGCFDKRT